MEKVLRIVGRGVLVLGVGIICVGLYLVGFSLFAPMQPPPSLNEGPGLASAIGLMVTTAGFVPFTVGLAIRAGLKRMNACAARSNGSLCRDAARACAREDLRRAHGSCRRYRRASCMASAAVIACFRAVRPRGHLWPCRRRVALARPDRLARSSTWCSDDAVQPGIAADDRPSSLRSGGRSPLNARTLSRHGMNRWPAALAVCETVPRLWRATRGPAASFSDEVLRVRMLLLRGYSRT